MLTVEQSLAIIERCMSAPDQLFQAFMTETEFERAEAAGKDAAGLATIERDGDGIVIVSFRTPDDSTGIEEIGRYLLAAAAVDTDHDAETALRVVGRYLHGEIMSELLCSPTDDSLALTRTFLVDRQEGPVAVVDPGWTSVTAMVEGRFCCRACGGRFESELREASVVLGRRRAGSPGEPGNALCTDCCSYCS